MNDKRKKLLERAQELLGSDETTLLRLYQELLAKLDDFPERIGFVGCCGPETVNDAHHRVTDSEGKTFTVHELVEAIRQRDQALLRLKVVLRGRRDREAQRLAAGLVDVLPLAVAVLNAHGSLRVVVEAATVTGGA